MQELLPAQLKKVLESGEEVMLIDIRKPEIFADGFIPGSINLSPDQFDLLLPYVISKKVEIIIITDDEVISEKVEDDLSGSSYINYLAWKNEEGIIDMIITIDAYEFGLDLKFDKSINVIDLRDPDEHEAVHINDSINIPLKDIPDTYDDFELTDQIYLYGTSLQDAMTAASLFKKQGYNLLKPIEGGFDAISNEQGIKLIKKKKSR